MHKPTTKSNNEINQQLISLLETHYDIIEKESSLEILRNNPGRTVAKITYKNEKSWVLRSYPCNSRHFQGLSAMSKVLDFLEQKNYRSPRIIKTSNGELTTTDSSQGIILLDYIEGKQADSSLPSLHALGQSLGRLHSLKLPLMDKAIPLPETLYSPQNEIDNSIQALNRISKKITSDTKQAYDYFLSILNQLHILEDTPKTIIHTDASSGNAVISKTGNAIFIDWDDAGIGYSLIDLGYLLCTSVNDQPCLHGLKPIPERIKSIIYGYRQHHCLLTQIEQESLMQGICFSATLYGVDHLVRSIEGSANGIEWRWWWARCRAATEIANIALQYFDDSRNDD
ncbi:MAG: hypothetical protein D3924_15725 [Candidatus Electrothrix sp. AR4]|nr:hypothetical protein [Candidatus Electrothrix sp. AR4]